MKEKQFLGTTELGEYIGWTRTKTHTYWKRGLLENPAAYVGTRPLWTYEQAIRIKKVVTK